VSLTKLGLYAVLGVVGYGLVTGQIDLGSIGDHTATPPIAAKKATASAVAGIPADYLALYKASAGKCAGLDWPVLAGIGFVESNHGQSTLPGVQSGANSAGARGPMQFLPGTWREVRADRPDIGADVYNPRNAIPGAAHYVCKYATNKGLTGALSQYGGGGGYAAKVTANANEYRK
jgi:hypothetical protein